MINFYVELRKYILYTIHESYKYMYLMGGKIMALDGIVISNIVNELNNLILDGRINKIAQPEKDELIITIKSNRELIRLLISANPSLPLLYITKENKPSPMTAPNFCMLLRKHLNSAKIISVSQPSLERVIDIEIEHYNELGDLCTKHLFIELMGKHSNIIFTDDEYTIIDSIKHISSMVSSIREVLPGRKYFIPCSDNKYNPYEIDLSTFQTILKEHDIILQKALYTSITGLSPLIAAQIAIKSDVEADINTSLLSQEDITRLYKSFCDLINLINNKDYYPNIIYKNNIPTEFSSIKLDGYNTIYSTIEYDSISDLLYDYYSQKNQHTRIQQKSSDLRKITQTLIERASKKLDLQLKQLNDTQKREKYKVYGDLIMAYSYDIVSGSKSYTCMNFYSDNEEITIPLDVNLSPTENGKKYYDKFSKLKRTYTALTTQVEDTKNELNHLESISISLDIAKNENDLNQIKKELADNGYIKHKSGTNNKKQKNTSTGTPIHYVTENGYHIYVGRNNYQNDELTFKFATGNDWWFHSKTLAGSHVILKAGENNIPDEVFELAASAAAYYSKGKTNEKVEIDYIQKKHVKKPNAAKPGFVIYHTNYSMMVKPDISKLKEISE